MLRLSALFCGGLAGAGVGVGLALLFFPTWASLVSVFLTALGLRGVMVRLLDDNRDAIWVRQARPWRANGDLALGTLAVFFGIFAAYLTGALLLEPELQRRVFAFQLERYGGNRLMVTELQFGGFTEILANNLMVLGVFLLLGLLYQEGGAMLCLAWNASVWGAAFGYMIGNRTVDGGFEYARYIGRTVLVLLPHLATEGGAYVLASAAGIFGLRAFTRHPLRSTSQERVLLAVVLLLLLALAVLALSAVIEANLTPWLVRKVVPRPLIPLPWLK